MENTKEIWKPVVGYEGLYEVSNLGRVRSLNYNGTGTKGTLSEATNKCGYKYLVLCNNGKRKHHLVHRLVAGAFLINPNNLPQVNHKDEHKDNNCIDNLEWCDNKYNNNYGTKNQWKRKKAV